MKENGLSGTKTISAQAGAGTGAELGKKGKSRGSTQFVNSILVHCHTCIDSYLSYAKWFMSIGVKLTELESLSWWRSKFLAFVMAPVGVLPSSAPVPAPTGL